MVSIKELDKWKAGWAQESKTIETKVKRKCMTVKIKFGYRDGSGRLVRQEKKHAKAYMGPLIFSIGNITITFNYFL